MKGVKLIRIKGDWQEELKHYEPNFSREYIAKKSKKEKARFNPTNVVYPETKVDRNTRGFIDPEKMPVLESIRKLVGLNDSQLNIQKYETGQAQITHIDYMPAYDLAERPGYEFQEKNEYENMHYERLLMMLKDRAPGQFMHIGDEMINHWQAGDCFYFNTSEYYHGAGNCGPDARFMLRISGLYTPKFQEFLSKGEHQL